MISDREIPHEISTLVHAELLAGERQGWVGQPIPGLFARKGWLFALFGIPWTAFAIFWVVSASGAVRSQGNVSGPFQFFSLFGVPFVLVGLGLLTAPYWMRRKARRTVYVITNQRAIIFEAGWWNGMNIRSFSPARLGDLRRVQHHDGSGDIVFERTWIVNRDNGSQAVDIGFLAIADVKKVEDALRKLVAQSQST